MTDEAPSRVWVDFTSAHIERVQRAARQHDEYAARACLTQKNGNGFKGDQHENHLLGAAGEMALFLWTGLRWRGEFYQGRPQPIDLGGDIEVKCSRKYFDAEKNEYMDLILRTTDRIAPRYVRTTLQENAGQWRVSLDGWAWGVEVQQARYWRDKANNGRWAWWFPIWNLRPMTTFRKRAFDDISNYYAASQLNGRVFARARAQGSLFDRAGQVQPVGPALQDAPPAPKRPVCERQIERRHQHQRVSGASLDSGRRLFHR